MLRYSFPLPRILSDDVVPYFWQLNAEPSRSAHRVIGGEIKCVWAHLKLHHLFQNKLLFGRARVRDGEVGQETLQFHQAGQLIDQHLCQETPELQHTKQKQRSSTVWRR